jgi:hypothetical protein
MLDAGYLINRKEQLLVLSSTQRPVSTHLLHHSVLEKLHIIVKILAYIDS